MAVILKKSLGEAAAFIDDSNGADRLYDVLKALAEGQNDLVAQFNQLKADHDAAQVPTSATDVAVSVEVE